MTPDNYIGSGFDFLGEEKLSGTTKVGFALRNRFNPDTGAFQTQDKLFDYESQLYVEGPYGLIGAGRMSPFSASVGTQGWMCPFDVFEAGCWSAVHAADDLGRVRQLPLLRHADL
jgi:predicted porin